MADNKPVKSRATNFHSRGTRFRDSRTPKLVAREKKLVPRGNMIPVEKFILYANWQCLILNLVCKIHT